MIWSIWGVNENYNQGITGAPVVLWAIGMLFFWVGARLASKSHLGMALDFKIHTRRVKLVLYSSLLLWILLLLAIIKAYGGIPILQFLTGALAVDAVNEIQASSIPGLFGVWFLANSILVIATSLMLVSNLSRRTFFTAILVLSICAVFFGAIVAGKRQSLLIAATIIIPSVIIGTKFFLTKNKARVLDRRIILSAIVSVIFLVIIFGVIGQVRTSNNIESSSLLQIFNYLEYPLINMEWQLSEFGLIGGASIITPLFAGLIPYKFISGSEFGLDNTFAIYSFFYPEPGIGAGYFGPIHLAFGVLGVLFFGLVTGYL
jgi:oligosaccharide repeat unit polymerase